jgi:putative ABC transport system permease protein
MEREIQAHLEFAADDLQRRGHSRDDAMRAARLHYGGVTQAMDAMRDQRGMPWLDDLGRDVRHGLRVLCQSPTFTIVAILTLALGIGANTAIFSIVNGVVLRPLGYSKPQQLMFLTSRFANLPQFWVSAPEYIEFRTLNQSFSSVGAYTIGAANLTADDRAQRVRAAFVDEHLLQALGVQPEQGRFFAPDETDTIGSTAGPNAALPPPLAILSRELWQTAFGGRPLVGKTVDVDARPYQVIGIMPAGVDLMDSHVEIWLPLGISVTNRQARASHYLYMIGRLKEGVSTAAAQTELNSLMQSWGERVGIKPGPQVSDHVFVPMTAGADGHILQMKPLQDQIVGGVSNAIWVLQAAVGLVLLIVCANLANLMLARAQTRRREFAVRTALGAGSGRLLRQLMTEGSLVSVAGGSLGVVFAHLAVQALIHAYPASIPRANDVAVDRHVLLFSFAVSIGTGLLFGAAPMMHSRVRGLADALKESASKGASATGRHRLRRVLVVAEAALALMLVIGAGLLIRTLYNLKNIDAGFDRSRLVTFSLTLPQATYRLPSARFRTFEPLLEKLRAIAGVQGATAMSGLPPERPLNEESIDVENYTAPEGGNHGNADYLQFVMADYFQTMGIPLVAGRGFEPADAAASGLLAVVNETFAKTFWKDQNPLGRRFRQVVPNAPWYSVIGVAKDVKQGGLNQKTGTELYIFVPQVPRSTFQTMNIVLRTTLPSQVLSHYIEQIVQEVDHNVPVVRFREMDDVFSDSIQRPRMLAELVGIFAGLALLLAAIGTYGVLSYVVAERRREIGIRLALGADRTHVLRQVMKEGVSLTIIGVVAGLAGAFAMNHLLASLLFGVRPTDASTLGAGTLTITLVAVFACWLPAWRASRLDPNAVLRDE